MVYLRASVPFLLDRIAQRGRDYEQTMSPDYLAWTPMVIGIVVLGLFPNIIFRITDPAVVHSLTAFAGH